MEQTDSQLLPYPEATDPGNAALQLQVLAEAIDDKLVTGFASYRDVVNMPVFMSRLNANQAGVASGVITTINFNEITYDTSGNTFNPSLPFFQQTGYYRIGCYVVSNPSAGITANSSCRVFIVYQQQLTTPFLGTIREQYESTTYQSSTGGEHQSLDALIRVENVDPPGSYIRCDMLHANAASTVTIQADSRLWFYRVSDLED